MKKSIIVFIAGLLIGLGAGAMCAKWRFHHPPSKEHRAERMLHRFTSKLDLTPDQTQAVKAILEQKREKFDAIREEMRPKFEAIRAATRDEIKLVLKPEQHEKFDKLHEEMAARWKKR